MSQMVPPGRTAVFYFGYSNPPRPNRPTTLGVSALIERDGLLLLELRSDCGRWGLVGGALDAGESLPAALSREVREETGLEVLAAVLFGVFSEPDRIVAYPDGNIVRNVAVVFRVVADDGEPRVSAESLALRFFERDELARLDIIEPARPIIDHYLTGSEVVVM